MKKNLLQDVTPANHKRSIRDVPLPTHKKHTTTKRHVKKVDGIREEDVLEQNFSKAEGSVFEPSTFHRTSTEQSSEEFEDSAREFYSENQDTPKHKKTKSPFMKKIIITVLILVAIFVGFTFSRTEATITITPKQTTQEVDLIIPLNETNQLTTETQITNTLSKTLPATAEQQVEKQASGRIKIINKHKETSQELVKNTRFQTSNGLIYRIRDSIEVPGYTMSGSTLVPGTLEVEVFADSAGDEYNTSNVSFTIPGFAGKDQFEKITAQSITDITGGYIGIRKVVSEDAKEKAQKDLEAELKLQIEQTQNQSTEYIIVPDITTLTYGELQDKAEGDSVTLSLSATVKAYSFVKKDLYNFIGQNTILNVSEADTFTIKNEGLSYIVNEKEIQIKGTAAIEWITNMLELKEKFANKKRSEISSVINSYNSFEKASADLSPFWKTRFPADIAKINTIISE